MWLLLGLLWLMWHGVAGHVDSRMGQRSGVVDILHHTGIDYSRGGRHTSHLMLCDDRSHKVVVTGSMLGSSYLFSHVGTSINV